MIDETILPRSSWIRETPRYRIDVSSEKVFGSGILGEAGNGILKIDGLTLSQPCFDLGDRIDGVSLEVVKVGNSIFVEERSRHRPMKHLC